MTGLALPRQRTRVRFARPKLPDSFLTELVCWATGFHFLGTVSHDWWKWYVGIEGQTREGAALTTILYLAFLHFWFIRRVVPQEARRAKVSTRLLISRIILGGVLGVPAVWVIRTDTPGFIFWMVVLWLDLWVFIRKGPPGSAA